MKINLRIILLFFFAVALPLQAESLGGEDKVKHFGISALLGYGFGYGVEKYTQANNTHKSNLFKVTVATSLALSIGLAKEIYDSQQTGNHFSEADLTADFAGSLTGALLSNYIHRKNRSFTLLITPKKPVQLTMFYHY